MIPAQQDELVPHLFASRNEEIQNTARIGASVYVVAEEDQASASALQVFEGLGEATYLSMHVPE